MPRRLAASARRPGTEFLGVAYRPDVPDPVARDLEREHRDGDAVLLGDQAGLAVDRTLHERQAGYRPGDVDAGARHPFAAFDGAAYAGGAGRAIWIVGAQKVVPDLSSALRRVEDHPLPLESARAQVAYGQPSAINRLLVLNAEPHPGRGTVLLLREAIGF
jgi:hypothetical protein